MQKGLLFVVSGPSGCGKGTILNEVKKEIPFYYSVSATTRGMREGEVDGVNYHFLTKEEFEKMISEDGMLEYAKFCENYYGTPRKAVEDMRNLGTDALLEIEVLGASQVREKCPDAISIFIMPPSIKELERRLRKRATEEESVIQKRLAQAEHEIPCAINYDYIVINSELEKAIEDVKSIIRTEHLKAVDKQKIVSEVLEK